MSLDDTSHLLQSSQNALFLFVMNLAILLSVSHGFTILEIVIIMWYMPYECDNAKEITYKLFEQNLLLKLNFLSKVYF